MWVANGQKEEVRETGWLGPLVARKVSSFPRTLVSVRDLVEALGAVTFDVDGVFATTSIGEKTTRSKIGEPLKSRLYSFDLPAVVRHVHEITPAQDCGGALVRQSGA